MWFLKKERQLILIKLEGYQKISYRGPALQYQIRITNPSNKTGDNFSITVPRIIAQQFENTFFRITVSGDSILFESGCKLTIQDINDAKPLEGKRVNIGGGTIIFK